MKQSSERKDETDAYTLCVVCVCECKRVYKRVYQYDVFYKCYLVITFSKRAAPPRERNFLFNILLVKMLVLLSTLISSCALFIAAAAAAAAVQTLFLFFEEGKNYNAIGWERLKERETETTEKRKKRKTAKKVRVRDREQNECDAKRVYGTHSLNAINWICVFIEDCTHCTSVQQVRKEYVCNFGRCCRCHCHCCCCCWLVISAIHMNNRIHRIK